jgi:ribosomal protein S18 acetylase RimI-like enzyme
MKHIKLFESYLYESDGWKLVISNPDANEWVVKALKGTKEIGRLDFIESRFKPVLKATGVTVDPAHRRVGVGSSMYEFAEKRLSKKFVRNEDVLTADGKSIWNSPNRKFGI